MTDKSHFEYKFLTESSCPSTEELNAFFSSRKYSVWQDKYYYTYRLPTTKILSNRALARLQEEITKQLNDGWKVQGSIVVSLKETKVYRMTGSEICSYDIISYTQALSKEETHDEYVKRKQAEFQQVPQDTSVLDEMKRQIADLQTKLEILSRPVSLSS